MILGSILAHAFFLYLLALISPTVSSKQIYLTSYQVSLVSFPSPSLIREKQVTAAVEEIKPLSEKPILKPVKENVAPIPPVKPSPAKPIVQEKSLPSLHKSVSDTASEPDILKLKKIPPITREQSPAPVEKPSHVEPKPVAPPVQATPHQNKKELSPVPSENVPPEQVISPSIAAVSAEVVTTGEGKTEQVPPSSLLKLPYYFRGIEQKISAHWAPPPVSSRSKEGVERIAVVQFVVQQNGRIDYQSIRLEKSSGNPLFDQSALRAIYNTNRLLPLPNWVKDDLRVHFEFKMRAHS